MFNLNESIRYWLYPFPTDMRKSFYTLSGLVTDQMGGNIRSGDAFILYVGNKIMLACQAM
ncbi:MAG: IS66 family insertion sequence element accessory protein TnpB [Parabacteroides sp.]|uniref:IS66 family insertion sequence element accessory protein TnpB n=1 Tax=Macellibacteroides fermentans TaxID=879969 RepID=UPI002A152E0D|nr:IS66 family insertion sequence element accessory protein TnpB [Parabacteroides sp.]MDD4432322.1 IS66 family insertion sequence element accessory protein TnpB [Parabacteroides sp.]